MSSGTALNPDILLTAKEAYPAFERAVLDARASIRMSFRIFDPGTKLRSKEALQFGETWFDLIVEMLDRGVDIEIDLADFDPIAATTLHRACWRSYRYLIAASEFAKSGRGRLTVRARRHPARAGLLPRILLWPVSASTLRKRRAELANLTGPQADTALAHLPGLRSVLRNNRYAPANLFPATHHQKLAIIDDQVVYIGGLDLDERRFDSLYHDQPSHQTWHDVQLLIRSRDVANAALQHLDSYAPSTSGAISPPNTPGILRTISKSRGPWNFWHLSPKPVLQELSERHKELINKSSELIYLESQFFRDRGLARALAKRAAQAPDLKLILVLPGAPDAIAFEDDISVDARFGEHLQDKCLKKLAHAFGERLLVASPVQQRPVAEQDHDNNRAGLCGSPLIYVHSKVSIFDNFAAIVSSANLNGRSLHWDTEAGVELTHGDDIARLRNRVFSHWVPNTPENARISDTMAAWKTVAARNASVVANERHGFLVPYAFSAAGADAAPLPTVPDELV